MSLGTKTQSGTEVNAHANRESEPGRGESSLLDSESSESELEDDETADLFENADRMGLSTLVDWYSGIAWPMVDRVTQIGVRISGAIGKWDWAGRRTTVLDSWDKEMLPELLKSLRTLKTRVDRIVQYVAYLVPGCPDFPNWGDQTQSLPGPSTTRSSAIETCDQLLPFVCRTLHTPNAYLRWYMSVSQRSDAETSAWSASSRNSQPGRKNEKDRPFEDPHESRRTSSISSYPGISFISAVSTSLDRVVYHEVLASVCKISVHFGLIVLFFHTTSSLQMDPTLLCV